MATENGRAGAGRAGQKSGKGPGFAARVLRSGLKAGALAGAAGAVVLAAYTLYLSHAITARFESGLWVTPSKVWARPLILKPGTALNAAAFKDRLERMGYRQTAERPAAPGQFRSVASAVELHTRDFRYPKGLVHGEAARVVFAGTRVAGIEALAGRRSREKLTLEPELIATLHGARQEDRTVLPLKDFPPDLVHAILASEDQRFFEHHGLDPLRILGALWQNLRSGDVRQGGSTITQQTVKNVFLGPERTLSRKLREAIMAVILEARYPKDRILEVYLNEIYLGQRGSVAVCGFAEAARHYFGKDVGDLSLGESALLVGLVPAPAVANPFVHPERAQARRDLVLRLMKEQGKISEEAQRKATSEKPVFASRSDGFRKAPHFVQLLRTQLSESYDETVLTEGGLQVFTTLDADLQAAAERALDRGLERLEKERPKLKRRGRDPIESAMVVLDPRSGELLALVGGRDFSRSQFDRVAQARRQPGSLFKPFVYMAGFERAEKEPEFPFTPLTLLEDEPFELLSGGKVWKPENYDNEFRGPVTVRRALEESINVPTVRAAQAVGAAHIVDLAGRCGIRSPLQPWPSIALGAQEVTPMEIATAYSVIASGGMLSEPSALLEVADANGKVLEKRQVVRSRVVSPAAAYLTLDLLRGVVNVGTARLVRDAGLTGELAGKTGTTNDKRDSWFIGFSPEILAAVWVGFDDNRETGLAGAAGALPIWIDFMRASGNGDSAGSFPEPPDIVRRLVDPATGGLAATDCPEAVDEVFILGTEPQDECPEHGSGLGHWLRKLFHRSRDRDRTL